MTRMGTCDHTYNGEHTHSGLCPECEGKMFGGFAELQGSEKQIAWAGSIRQERLQELAGALLMRGAVADMDERGLAVTRKLAQVDTARFWIDHRMADVQELLKAGMGL